MRRLKIANGYGNVDIRKQSLKGHVHIPGNRLQSICRSLNISYAPAVDGWDGKKRYGFHPTFDGVVVTIASSEKLIRAIKFRAMMRV